MQSATMGGILRRTGLLTEAQLATVLQNAGKSDFDAVAAVVREGFAAEEPLLQALGKELGLEVFPLAAATIAPEILLKIPTKAVFQYNVIPVAMENGALSVAIHNPFEPGLADALRLASGLRIRLVLARAPDISAATKKFYGVGAETVEKLIEEGRIEVEPVSQFDKADINDLDQEASIVRFVNQIVWEAYKERATDIHLEPMEKELRIRYRVDGLLHQTPLPPQLARFQSAIISRIKVMSNMDIAEKRLPQDGRIGMRIRGEDLDIRVSTMPTVYGESVSLRLLMRGKQFIGFTELGLRERDAQIMRRMIERPNGIILVTGPTGSGKSTSLYAYLREINTIDQRLITVEDPIEYEMPGVNQINVKAEIGLTFATALRHILRQDPDVIMIGEVRDFETAEIAIRAALTGHLVFSTLHTNDAAGAITRLLDMGVEPFLLASSLECVVAQRLVRRLCPACKRPCQPDKALIKSAGFPVERLSEVTIYEAAGCDKCRQSGYRGRMGIYEVLEVDEFIETMIPARAPSGVIKQKAIDQGMLTLRNDGFLRVLDGLTTIDEIIRVTEESA